MQKSPASAFTSKYGRLLANKKKGRLATSFPHKIMLLQQSLLQVLPCKQSEIHFMMNAYQSIDLRGKERLKKSTNGV